MKIVSFIKAKKFYILSFFVPIIILLIAYFIMGLYPIGDMSTLICDLNDQYVNYYEHFRDVLHGNGSPFISWSRNLSGETVGIFAYYIASPFILIPLLLPRSTMQESVLIMQLMKVGTASLSFCFYIKNSRNVTGPTAFIFSTAYSLMSYMIVYLMNPMWLDGIIWLPIICYGIERLIDKGKCFLFAFSLAMMFMANFYIGWMITIFSCLYFLVYFFALSERTAELRRFLVQGVKFALSGILAALCSAWLLMPTYFSLSLGKFDFSEPNHSIITNFNILSFFANLFPNAYDSVKSGGSPMIYCGILTIISVPLYFMNKDINLKKKIGYGTLLIALVLSMWIYPLDIVWHGFQEPIWFHYRYSFLFSFLLLVIAAQMFEKIQNVSIVKFLCIAAVLSIYIILMYFNFRTTVVYDGSVMEKIQLYATVYFSIIFLLLYGAVLFVHRKGKEVKHIRLKTALLLCLEMIFTVSYNIYDIKDDVIYSWHHVYNKFITLGRNTVQRVGEMDNGVYRMEKNFFRTVNDPMAFGFYGISNTSSTLNDGVYNFFVNTGFSRHTYGITYRGTTYIMDSLLGIKYVMEQGSAYTGPIEDTNGDTVIIEKPEIAKSKMYDKLVLANGDEKNIIYVYEDPYALPIGFMADNAIADVEFDSWYNPFENQNMLFSALFSDEKQDFFKRIDIDEVTAENAEYSEFDGHKKYTAVSEDELASVEFKFTAPSEDVVYMFMPSEHLEHITLFMNDEFINHYFLTPENMMIQNLGRFSEGEEVTIKANIAGENNEMIFKENYMYYLDEAKFHEAVEKLKSQPLNITSFKEDHIIGNVTAEKDGILFTSISYEPGWTVYVDGVETEQIKIADALMGIPMTAGEHSVEMKFFPKGLAAGIAVSAVGIVILVIIGICERKKRSA